MDFLRNLLLGNGRLRPDTVASLRSEGLRFLEEGLPGKLRYAHFKSPGRRFHGKVTPERIGLGVSEQRLVLYCRSGRVKLIDTPFSDLRLAQVVDVSLPAPDALALRLDFDRAGRPNVSGQMTITVTTPNAPDIAGYLEPRLDN